MEQNNAVAQKRSTFIALGVLLGALGIHDFWAKRKKFAFIHLGLAIIYMILYVNANSLAAEAFQAQSEEMMAEAGTMAIFSWVLGLGNWLWAVIESCMVKKNGLGVPFN